MQIQFEGEAGDSFASMITGLVGYTVQITTLDDEKFDARVVGAWGSDWLDAVRFRRALDEDAQEFSNEIEELRVKNVLVY